MGTQESCSLSDWERIVAQAMGSRYVRIAQEGLMAINIIVYARSQLAPHISSVRTSSIACGVGNVLGNKGGAAVSMMIGGVRMLMVTSHLAAHDEFVDRRNADYHRICAGLFSGTPPTNSGANTPAPGKNNTIAPAPAPLPPLAGISPSSSPASSPLRQVPGTLLHDAAAAAAAARQGLDPSSSSHHTSFSPDLTTSSAALSVGGRTDSTTSNASGVSFIHNPSSHITGETALQQATPYTPLTARSRPGTAGSTASIASGDNSNHFQGLQHSASGPNLKGMGNSPKLGKGNVLQQHDVVIWTGDLNYRINGNPTGVKFLIDNNMSEVLHVNDQLRIQQKKGKAFQVGILCGAMPVRLAGGVTDVLWPTCWSLL